MKNTWSASACSCCCKVRGRSGRNPRATWWRPGRARIDQRHNCGAVGHKRDGNSDDTNSLRAGLGLGRGSLTILPEDGRKLYFEAIDAAKNEIRIEICVLEDPQILEHLQAALRRGVQVRSIVDRGKYEALDTEQDNLAQYLASARGQLHLSNPVFPRSFPRSSV